MQAQSKKPVWSSSEIRLQTADAHWLQGDHQRASTLYGSLLEDADLPKVARPMVLLRLARVQMLANRQEASRAALTALERLPALAPHHRMAAEELRLILAGRQSEVLARTPVPSWQKSAAIIHVFFDMDGGDGSLTLPWGTLQEGLAHARRLRAAGSLSPGPIEIQIEGPILPVRETIRLTREDSGTQRNPLLIRGVYHRPTVLSGAVVLEHWKKITDPKILARLRPAVRGRVLVADFAENGVPALPALELGGFSSPRAQGGSHRFKTMAVPELFYEGKVQRMARWPDHENVQSKLTAFEIDRPLRWVDEEDLWLHGYWHHSWADAYEKVASIDIAKRIIHLEPPTNRYGFKRSQWHAVNALSELDQVGEWHFDAAAGKIRYLPPEKGDPSQCWLSCYGPILDVEDCDYLMIQHLAFLAVRGDCLVLRDCDDFTLADSRMENSSGYGLKIEGGRRHRVLGCSIRSMGRGGIEMRTGDRLALLSSDSVIENCEISDLSRIDRTYTPALVLDGMGIKVRYCKFELIPSSAIRLEGNDMLIELNEFTRCVWESDDQGAIDMWGNPTYRGNVIRWNSFHDNIKPKARYVAGVRLDDAISGTSIYENLFINTSSGRFGGTQIHGGKDNYIEGNLFLDCKIAMSQTPWGRKRWLDKLANHSSIARSLEVTPWQSSDWQKRYPSLASLLAGPVDRNWFLDNRVIGAEVLIARKSKSSLSFNNRSGPGEPGKVAGGGVAGVLWPWHPIPWESIGSYGKKR